MSFTDGAMMVDKVVRPRNSSRKVVERLIGKGILWQPTRVLASARRRLIHKSAAERRFHQAGRPRWLDGRAEALLHKSHDPAHVLHARSAGFSDDLEDFCFRFGIIQLFW